MVHPPFTTTHEVEWAQAREGSLAEGQYFDRGVIKFDNGYALSILRTNHPDVASMGHEDGKWETMPIQPTTNPFLLMQGLDFEPARQWDHLLNETITGETVGDPDMPPEPVGVFTDDEVNALADTIAAAEPFVAEESELSRLFASILGGSEQE